MLAAPPGELARALVGGPRLEAGSVRAVVRVRAGGVALVAQQQSPGQALVGELVPGAPARIVRLAGAERPRAVQRRGRGRLRSGRAGDRLASIEGGRATLARDDATLVACALDGTARGAWGVAALGAEAAAQVAVDTVTVSRAPLRR